MFSEIKTTKAIIEKSFNEKIIPITGASYDEFSGNGTQNSEVTHHLVAGKKYTITAILKQYNESYPVYLQFFNRSDDSFAFSGLTLNSQTTEAVKEYTPKKDLDVYIQYFTGYADSIAEVRIESVSEFEETKSTAELVWEDVLKLANRIDKEFEESNPSIPWRVLYGLRNKIVHDYEGVNLVLIWDIVKEDLPELNIQLVELNQKL